VNVAADRIEALAIQIVERATRLSVRIATAESCTGGLVAAALTAIPGSSAVLDRGFVTYSNAAKSEMLGVPATTIEAQGAVSQAVAEAMAQGALARSQAGLAVSITGIAGPGGATETKPIGLVQFGCATATTTSYRECRFGDLGRSEVRTASVIVALDMLLHALDGMELVSS
jgi:nicotinamide-nucleotide amidase